MRARLLAALVALVSCGVAMADATREGPLVCYDAKGRVTVAAHEIRRVGDAVTKPEVIERVWPRYPESARHVQVQGPVIVETVIDRGGTVCAARVLKGRADPFTDKAIAALGRWRFKPATLNGKPVPVYLVLTIHRCP